MSEIKKRFVKMTCKSCKQVSVIECEPTTNDEYNVNMGVELGCNDALTESFKEKGSTPHYKIKEALNRLKDEYGFGIPDKETVNDN
tara:strand:- start:2742 stop:2999 length:258 start_codon:yes stop_codon:yes gene_type:complete